MLAKVVLPEVGMRLHLRLMGWSMFRSCDLNSPALVGVQVRYSVTYIIWSSSQCEVPAYVFMYRRSLGAAWV
jgi:hypothetical protein